MDLSKLSDQDLAAISAGDMSKVSSAGLSVLAGAPAGNSSAGGKGSGFVQGLKDSINGPAQLLYNALPTGVQKAGDAVDNWMYDKTGGALGTAPGGFNHAVATQNAEYEANREAAGRTGFDFARTGGNIVGTAPLAIATGGAPAATLKAAVGKGMLSGAATGAAAPVTNQDVDYWSEKGKQTAIGVGAGGLGSTVARGIAAVASPVIGKAQQALIDAGVTLTPGQLMGGALKTAEEKLASVPVLGSFIKGAQTRTTEDLNRAVYNRVLDPLKEAGIQVQVPKEAGREAIDSISRQVSDAYNNEVLPRLTLKVDPRLIAELTNLKQMASQGLEGPQAARFASLLADKVEKNIAGGASTGQTLKGMLSDLEKDATGYVSDPSYANRQLGAALKTAVQTIKDGIARTDPTSARLLAKVDEAFANLARAQVAAGGQGASNGVFSAAQLAAAVKNGDKTVRDNAYARGNAFMQDLSDPAKQVLGNTVPNSGTADRGMLAYALGAGAAGTLNPWLAAGAGAAALPYTGLGQKTIQALIANRSDNARALGALLRNNSTAIGAATAPALIGAANQ